LLWNNLLIKPTGKTIAEIVRMSPGAFVWNHGDELVESARAQPKEIKAPPMNELTNILSILMRAFLAPIRETSSVVWAGVNASMLIPYTNLSQRNFTKIRRNDTG
jgi:hypothetical protein